MSDALIKVPKGTRDLVGRDVEAFAELERIARRAFGLFRFGEIRTPVFEPVELFSRSLGATSDVVEKEMFTFEDRGDRTYALRPEGTAGVVRHFIENNLAVKGGSHRFFYVGPMFRGERPQKDRYRQFWQIGSEQFGVAEASADADTVAVAARILRDFGLSRFTVNVNSLGCVECRPRYRAALLDYLRARQDRLTEESRRRMEINPLRVLDSKADGPKLSDAPVMRDFLCDACRAHDAEFRSLSGAIEGITLEENPRLVRGLDYYNRTVFEFVSPDLGAQSALAAGGRYDGLVAELGGPATPAVGFALGIDRVVSARFAKGGELPVPAALQAMVIPVEPLALEACYRLANELREAGVAVPGVQAARKLKHQLSQAVDTGANWAILVGGDELSKNEVTVKDLSTREQKRVGRADIVALLSRSR